MQAINCVIRQIMKRIGAVFFTVVLLSLASNISEAGVRLLGWKDINGSLTPDGSANRAGTYQRVLFGRYVNNRPILWRVLSADQVGTNRKGYLYSERALKTFAPFDSSMNNYGLSSIRAYLVSNDTDGFYVDSNFAPSEKGAVVVQSLATTGGNGSNPTTTDNPMFLLPKNDLQEPKYGFWSNSGRDVNRVALDIANNTIPYWSRTPVSGGLGRAWAINRGGYHFGLAVDSTDVALRPAFFLALEAIVFKTASNDLGPGGAPSGAGGTVENPYVLIFPDTLPTGAPDGWAVKFISGDNVPLDAKIKGKNLVLEWSSAISPAVKKWPDPGDFTLGTGEHPKGITSDDSNDRILKLTFAKGASMGDVVTLSYNLNTDAISFDSSGSTAKVVGSFSNLGMTNETPPEPEIPEIKQSLESLLSHLNISLSPNVIIAPLSSRDAISMALPSSVAFTKKMLPTTPLTDYTALVPSFNAAVVLGAGVNGDILALKCTVKMSSLLSFENWKNMSDNERIAQLNVQEVIFAYEYADRTWASLVGAGGILSWGDAYKAGIISFTETSMTIGYAVTDAAGKPSANGNVLLLPDGLRDNRITDPLWLMSKKAEPVKIIPTAVSLSNSALELKAGESTMLTASFTPENATERDLIWTVSNMGTAQTVAAQIEKTTQPDLYKVTGIAEGEVAFTATVSADRGVAATLNVTVVGDEPDPKGGRSGGCDSGIGISVFALGLFWILRRQGS